MPPFGSLHCPGLAWLSALLTPNHCCGEAFGSDHLDENDGTQGTQRETDVDRYTYLDPPGQVFPGDNSPGSPPVRVFKQPGQEGAGVYI